MRIVSDQVADLSQAVTAINLRRARQAALVGLFLAGWNLLFNLSAPGMRLRDLAFWQLVSLGGFALLLILAIWFSSETTPPSRQAGFILAFTVSLLVICDGFFFALWPHLQTNAAYSRGMLIVSVLFLLPPRKFVILAFANQLVLTVYLVWQSNEKPVWIAWLDGTTSTIVACVISSILYGSKRDDLQKTFAIALQNEDMRNLMAIAAHDLRSPLLGVRNLLEFVRSRCEMTRDQLLRAVDQAVMGCDRMLVLVERLLKAHEAEHQGLRSQPQSVDLRVCVRASAVRAQATLAAKQMLLRIDLPELPAPAIIDQEAFGQILDNLFSNAAKFSPPGSTVTITLSATAKSWLVEMHDEGPGIPDKERAALFQKFHRGANRPTGGEPCAGMGLFIVKSLAESMGATVAFSPRHPRGSTFQVLFPRHS